MENGSQKAENGRLANQVLCAVLVVISVCALAAFLHFNSQTRKTVQAERENYVSEIAGQLTRNIENLQRAYSREVSEDAEMLLANSPKTPEELRRLYSDRENAKHFLVTAAGQVTDISGKMYTLSDEFFPTKIQNADEGKVVMTYTTVNLTTDYLLFGKRFEPVTIGGTTYVAWAVGVTSDQFRNNMTISLFSGLGAGYLISQDGSIVIKPNDSSMVFSGYNLFSALAAGGVSAGQLAQIEDKITARESGSTTISVNGLNWLISFKSTEFDGDFIVVAVPLSLTAAETYSSMSLTVVFAFVFVAALAGVMGLILLSSFRRRREEDRRAAATDAQTSFLSKMSHDIRTPLNAVTGMLQLAGDPNHSRAEVDGFVAKASESADYLLELVNGMLDLQKISSGKMEVAREPFSMRELLGDVGSMYAPVLEGKGLKFRTAGAEDFSGGYIGDSVKIKQILVNLLSNASKFTPRGGEVSLTADRTGLDSGRDEVRITVTDTGIGMSEDFQRRLFRPFEQEKTSYTSGYVGTGLGLNIVKNLSELMGGSVSVKSAPGAGSSFTVKLPLERGGPAAETVRSAAADSPAPFARQRILLAEDNAINQQIAVLLMRERLNLEVDAVDDGQKAVEKLAGSRPGDYAAVILDVRMPVMDGLQAARAIRALDRPDAGTIPILALSANTFAEDVRQSLNAGMNAHLAKPIDIGELSAALHKYIG